MLKIEESLVKNYNIAKNYCVEVYKTFQKYPESKQVEILLKTMTVALLAGLIVAPLGSFTIAFTVLFASGAGSFVFFVKNPKIFLKRDFVRRCKRMWNNAFHGQQQEPIIRTYTPYTPYPRQYYYPQPQTTPLPFLDRVAQGASRIWCKELGDGDVFNSRISDAVVDEIDGPPTSS